MEADGFLEIAVEDSGIGIPADALERIFEEFGRSDQAVERRIEGVGLGLAITRRLVQMHGGTVGVTSEIGRGSTFTVRLPLDGPPTAEEEPGETDRAAAPPPETLSSETGENR